MLIRKLREAIANAAGAAFNIKSMYYFVPQCPICTSWKTGRYVAEPRIDAEYMYRKSLEHGELIRFVPIEPIKNCFCTECDHEWSAHIKMVFLTADEIAEQKRIRGTGELFRKYKEENYVNGKPPKPSLFNRWFL